MIILTVNNLDKRKPIRVLENRFKSIESIFQSKQVVTNTMHNSNNNFKNLVRDVLKPLNKKYPTFVYYLNSMLNNYLSYTDDIIQTVIVTSSDILINDLYKMYIIKVNEYCDDIKDKIIGNLKNDSTITK